MNTLLQTVLLLLKIFLLGTHDIHALIIGRQITGIPSFWLVLYVFRLIGAHLTVFYFDWPKW